MNRGILFSPGMIKAILGGTKTETRRLSGLKIINESPDDWNFLHLSDTINDRHFASFKHKKSGLMKTYACPFGKKGDVLHIKETFCQVGDQVVFKSDGSEKLSGGRWAPGWFMPFDIARFFIQNEGVKIQRLQDITESGAVREGIDFRDKDWNYTARDAFFDLLKSLHDAKIVALNPYVWVLNFFLSSYKVNVKFTENE